MTTLTRWPSLSGEVREALEAIVQTLAQRPEVSKIILFGSWAEGSARPDSDLDLLIVMRTKTRLHTAMMITDQLQPLTGGRQLDVVIVPTERWEQVRRLRGMIAWEADRYGVKLYDRSGK